jgi:hypothetical protein
LTHTDPACQQKHQSNETIAHSFPLHSTEQDSIEEIIFPSSNLGGVIPTGTVFQAGEKFPRNRPLN